MIRAALLIIASLSLAACAGSHFENCRGNPKAPTGQDTEDGKLGWRCDIEKD